MPQLKSAKKALKQAKKKALANDKVKRVLKATLKETEKALSEGKADMAELIQKSQKTLAKAAKKGIIKKQTASRKLSRLAKAAQKNLKK